MQLAEFGIGRVDLVGIFWIALAHIVNLTKKPVGPNETKDGDAQLTVTCCVQVLSSRTKTFPST